MIIEALDSLAGAVCVRHMGRDVHPDTIFVTASVDRIVAQRPLIAHKDMYLNGAVVHTGRSSMRVRVEVVTSAKDDESRGRAFVVGGVGRCYSACLCVVDCLFD